MLNALTNLHLGFPEMWRVGSFAIIALEVFDGKGYHINLLKNSSVHHFLL